MKWEYKQLVGPCEPAQIQSKCQEHGKQGWELCGMMSVMLATPPQMNQGRVIELPPQAGVLLQFKRPGDDSKQKFQAELAELATGA